MEIAGFDADSIVRQLMQIEQRPLIALQNRQAAARTSADAIGRIRSKVDAFRLAADRLSSMTAFNRFQTTVSHPDALVASAGPGATSGSLSFTVDRLAQAHGLRSTGTVASESVAVTSESVLAVAAGTDRLGIGTVRAGAGMTPSSVSVTVVQSSGSATVVGVSPPVASTVIDGSNNSFDVTVDGVAISVTVAHGTYTPAELVSAVQSAINNAGGDVDARLDSSGTIALSTRSEGSAASIQVTGGTALTALGLDVDAVARTGTDGVIDIGGITTVVSSARAGTTVAADTGAGTLQLELSGGLRTGEARVVTVSTGDRSLGAVAAAINAAGAGVSAAAVRVDTGQWRLQLNATRTGEDARIAIDGDALGGLGGLVVTSEAQNARITIGTGPGAYSIEASGNTFANVLPGVTLTARQVTSGPVTVTTERSHDSIANDVAGMISAINDLLADIKVQTRTDPTARTSSALAGSSAMRQLAEEVRNALAFPVAGGPISIPAMVGIERTREGSFTFDRAKFVEALTNDPAAVAALFARGGTSTGDAVFAAAGPLTRAGAYDVEITTPPSQATSTLLFDGGGAETRVGVRFGSTVVTVDVWAGQSNAQIVDAFNAAFADAGVAMVAETDGGGLRVRARDWGSAGDFELNVDLVGGGPWDAVTGTDVAGTIDGIAAVGVGRTLSLGANESSGAAGLSVNIAAGAVGALGQVEYRPGIAARVVEVTSAMTRADSGLLTTAKRAADDRIKSFGDQIERLEDRLSIREINMRRQWSALQTLLSGLQTQGAWLGSQLSALRTDWSS